MTLLPTPPSPPIVLSFAATDPSSGAGIQADLMTISSMGCHGLSVVTAITAQDSVGIDSVLSIDPEWIDRQARTILGDMPVNVFKIGLLGSRENVIAVSRILADYPDIPVVFDPVLASGRGDKLSDEAMIATMCDLLLPRTTILTPNSLEARRLALAVDDTPCENETSLANCASLLLHRGCQFVLLTGTHENTSLVINTLYGQTGIRRSDEWDRLPGSYHGSGCTLASAVAANLARGLPVEDAVYAAQKYAWQTLAAGFKPGMGQFIPNRFFWAKS